MEMIRRYQVSLGRSDPVSSWQARIKRASSMREKLRRRGLPETAETALSEIRDAAGVRLVCPFVEDIYRTADLIRAIPGIRIHREKETISARPSPTATGAFIWWCDAAAAVSAGGTGGARRAGRCSCGTIAMDCWASIEHRVKYKREVPEQKLIVQELKRCADEIASTDLSLQTIRELIETLK